ncbi:metallophosphoesterase [Tritonibacter mobilis]|uniref:metallophosphoesterase n=1 Tax=Tritonibacter mobilis TaxID=379347 RepID=UPI000E0D83A7|nr:metallophosphoesterase [Tritonibacter mobilis]
MLATLLQKLRRNAEHTTTPPRPDQPLAVIGDVHGCLILLQDLLARIPAGMQVFLAGDYIDRGEDSAGVLRFLMSRPDLICLRGNHEAMLLQFLDDPERYGARWLRNGGLQTLASFRVAAQPNAERAELHSCRDALAEAMGTELIQWLKALAPSHLSGNVLITHAGADPAVAPDYQDPDVLAWGHADFAKKPRRDGIWVVHGHVIQNQPSALKGRIAVDTGAYATGRLTAALIAPDQPVQFLTT